MCSKILDLHGGRLVIARHRKHSGSRYPRRADLPGRQGGGPPIVAGIRHLIARLRVTKPREIPGPGGIPGLATPMRIAMTWMDFGSFYRIDVISDKR